MSPHMVVSMYTIRIDRISLGLNDCAKSDYGPIDLQAMKACVCLDRD